MEVEIHPKSDLKEGDLLQVEMIYENRFDMVKLKNIRSARLEKIVYRGDLLSVCRKLIDYRKHNTLNFQLEKADDFLRDIENILNSIDR